MTGASTSVLDALADALHLGDDQRRYLYTLTNKKVTPRTTRVEHVPPQTQLLLDNLVDAPALVLGRCLDVLAWNTLAAALFIDFGQVPRHDRNFIRLLFLDPEVRGRYADWQSNRAYLRSVPSDGRYGTPDRSPAHGSHRRTVRPRCGLQDLVGAT